MRGGIAVSEGLVFGVRADGTLAHISEVGSGLACGCRCPRCGTPLVARRGDRVQHHFGHHGAAGERSCHGGPETALHRFAKELLASKLTLALPPVLRDGERQPLHPGGPYRFDSALLEHRLGTIVPDVIVRRADRDLLVEFQVTHACGPDKIAGIANLGLAAVEIDLSGLLQSAGRRDLEDAILFRSPRRWLHNPKLQRVSAALAEAVDRPVRPDRTSAALERAYAAACREVRAMPVAGLAPARIEADGLSHAIGLEVAGFGCFSVSPRDWQALILMSALDRALVRGPGAVKVETALRQVRERGWVRRRFSRLQPAEVASLRTASSSFALPDMAIAAWATALSLQGLLIPSGRRNEWIIRRETLHSARDARHHGVACGR
ncbi:hypothetical protein GOFOIKOB_5423 [Methylobacterium tardum]|nr:hypothetical protein GOFOIKOB_5423 [Methylobacterium tardum]